MRRCVCIGWRWIVALSVITAAAPDRDEAAGQALTKLSSQSGNERPLPILGTAEQIHLLTREEAAHGHHAVIRGGVTCSLPQSEAAVIQDLTIVIYIDRLT